MNSLTDAVKEWRDAREAVLSYQLEFEKTKKGMEVTDTSAGAHIVLLRRLGNAEHQLYKVAKELRTCIRCGCDISERLSMVCDRCAFVDELESKLTAKALEQLE